MIVLFGSMEDPTGVEEIVLVERRRAVCHVWDHLRSLLPPLLAGDGSQDSLLEPIKPPTRSPKPLGKWMDERHGAAVVVIPVGTTTSIETSEARTAKLTTPLRAQITPFLYVDVLVQFRESKVRSLLLASKMALTG